MSSTTMSPPSSPKQQDTTWTKIFVGGLAWSTDNESLTQYFEQFGTVTTAHIVKDKLSGRSKGYGFVTFADPSSATAALVDPFPIVDGRRTNVNYAVLGAKKPGADSVPVYMAPHGYSTPFAIPTMPLGTYAMAPGFIYPSTFYPPIGYPIYYGGDMYDSSNSYMVDPQTGQYIVKGNIAQGSEESSTADSASPENFYDSPTMNHQGGELAQCV
eukprot:GILK01004440.1.p1 GENE.GILK01004440.1~~GILK01004440.1.p1  ORF type:complete len:214 (+),score=16.49 GILK01004440.1:208-849(+)